MKRVPLIHIIIATGFGSGFSPFAPGTAGACLLYTSGVWNTGHKIFKSVNVELDVAGYYQQAGKLWPFDNGYGVYALSLIHICMEWMVLSVSCCIQL